MVKLELEKFINSPVKNLSKVVDITTLENTVENNEWHLSQNVLDHTLEVFNNIENIFNLNFPFSEQLLSCKNDFQNYANEVISKNHTRLNLLKSAALFHDIDKPTTMQINNVGITSCPNHASLSAKSFKKFANLIDINSIEENYIVEVINKHHTPDNFLDFIGSDDFHNKKNIFISENKSFSIDLLIFYLADFEGCRVNDKIALMKSHIYSESIECIKNILFEYNRNR